VLIASADVSDAQGKLYAKAPSLSGSAVVGSESETGSTDVFSSKWEERGDKVGTWLIVEVGEER